MTPLVQLRWLDPEDWDEALRLVAVRLGGSGWGDPYFSGEYAAWHRDQGIPVGLLVETERGALWLSGLLHPIDGAPGTFDLQTPNGYGGPLWFGPPDPPLCERAWACATEALRARGVVAALFRLHPLLDQRDWLPASRTLLDDRETVVVSLRGGVGAVLAAADSRHRNMLSRGARAGAAAQLESATSGAWSEFEQLYGQAMERLGARDELRFERRYFDELRQSARARLVTLSDAAGLVAGAIFLFGPSWAHYHLSARRPDAPNYAMNLVLQRGLEEALERGLDELHLGGGTTSAIDNPLFRFKCSLAPGRARFRLARVLVDAARFEAIVTAWEVASGRRRRLLLPYRDHA